MGKITNRAAVAGLGILCMCFAQGKNADELKITTENGIQVVCNPDHPVPAEGSPRDILFREDFSVGTAVGDPHYVFGEVISFAADDEGCLYILDWRAKEVRKFDPAGKYVLSFGRPGQGPGEFSSPDEIRCLPDGQVAVFEGESQRFSFFSKSGQLAKSGRFRKLMYSPYFALSNGHLLGTQVLRDETRNRFITGLFNGESDLIAPLVEVERPLDLPWPDQNDIEGRAKRLAETFSRVAFQRAPIITLNEREEIYFAHTDKFEVKILSPDAKLLKMIRAELPFLPVEKEDREYFLNTILPKEISTWRGMDKAFQDKIKSLVRFPERKPAFLSLIPMDNGSLLIVRDCPRQSQALVDIFDASGRLIIEKKLPFGIINGICRRGRLYTAFEDAEGNKSVKCFRYEFTGGRS